MKQCSSKAILLTVLVLIGIPSTASAKGVGLDVMVGAGLNVCMDDGKAKCQSESGSEGIEPSWNIFGAVGKKFTPNLGLYLDVTYGSFQLSPEPSGDVAVSMLTAMPTVRGFYPISKSAEV